MRAEQKFFPIPEYQKVGSGAETLLLIPCMSGRWNQWQEFMERNQTRYTMYAITIPGFGGTPVPDLPTDGQTTPWHDNAVMALSKFIDEHQLKDLTVVGHSWGTMMSVEIAAKRADVVRRLVVLDGAIENTTWSPKTPAERFEQANQAITNARQTYQSPDRWQSFNTPFALPAGETVSRDLARQALRMHGSFLMTPKEVVFAYWRENILLDLTAATKRLRIPILDIKCLRDPQPNAAQPKTQAEQKAQHLANLQQAGIANAVKTLFFHDTPHFLMFFKAAELDKTIADFLAEPRSGK